MIKFTEKEVTHILNFASMVVEDEPNTFDSYDAAVTEYLNTRLAWLQEEEDNKSLRKTL